MFKTKVYSSNIECAKLRALKLKTIGMDFILIDFQKYRVALGLIKVNYYFLISKP